MIFEQDQRVYNKPEVSQVAAILVDGQENGEHAERNIEVTTHSNESKSIKYYYGCYDPLQYPLMFPFGELGWHQHIPKRNVGENKRRRACKYPKCLFLLQVSEKLISPASILNAEDLLHMEKKVLSENADSSRYVSIREYYAYKLQIRKHDTTRVL